MLLSVCVLHRHYRFFKNVTSPPLGLSANFRPPHTRYDACMAHRFSRVVQNASHMQGGYTLRMGVPTINLSETPRNARGSRCSNKSSCVDNIHTCNGPGVLQYPLRKCGGRCYFVFSLMGSSGVSKCKQALAAGRRLVFRVSQNSKQHMLSRSIYVLMTKRICTTYWYMIKNMIAVQILNTPPPANKKIYETRHLRVADSASLL